MAKCKQIKANGVVYTISPEELSDGNGHVMTAPTLTQDTYIQPLLQSGTNIKTINNISVLGSGNIDVSGGGSSCTPLVTIAQAATVTLDPYTLYTFGIVTIGMTISFNSAAVETGYVPEYSFKFIAGTGCSITLPSTCKYCGGSAPIFTTGRTYEYNIADGLVVVGEFY